MLVSVLHDIRRINFKHIEKLSPDLHEVDFNSEMIKDMVRPRIFKSHKCYVDNLHNLINRSKVIYIYRDVRDVIVSLYYYYLKMDEKMEFNDFFEQFINGEKFKAAQFTNWEKVNTSSWENNVSSWLKHKDKVYVLKYENLVDNTLNEIRDILNWLNVNYKKDKLEEYIDYCSFTRLQNIEKSEDKIKYITINKDIQFIRSGKIGQWKDIFNNDQKAKIKEKYGDLLISLGYETDLNW